MKFLYVANWKMNMSVSQVSRFITALNEEMSAHGQSIVICPSFVHLTLAQEQLKAQFSYGAQNCASFDNGAHTGEVSARMLKELGCRYTIIGHSERRLSCHETNTEIAQKMLQLIKNEIIPIVCIGETAAEFEAQQTIKILESQLQPIAALLTSYTVSELYISYEPVWAIGTGVNATPAQAQEMHQYIRSLIARKYGETVANNTSILYGGSCKPSNAGELFANPDVDGGLIGGASLKADDFIGIAKAF